MATIPEQLTAAAVTDTLKYESTAKAEAGGWKKLVWAGGVGTWSTSGWRPPGYVKHEPDGSNGGDWLSTKKQTGGSNFVYLVSPTFGTLQATSGEEFRQRSVWLYTTGEGTANGYQLRCKDTVVGTSTKYKLRLSKYTGGVETLIKEVEVEIEANGGIALVKSGGKLGMYVRKNEAAAWVLVGGEEFADVTYTEGYSGIDGNGSNPTIVNFATGTLEEAKVEFSFSPSGSSASSGSLGEEITRAEIVAGASASTAEEADLFTMEEAISGVSTSTGTDTVEYAELFVSMTLNGTSQSTAASRFNMILAPTGDEIAEWGKPSTTELSAIEGPGIVSGKKPIRMKRIAAGTGNVTAWSPNIYPSPGTVVSVSAYRQGSSEPASKLRIGIDWKKLGGTYITSSPSGEEIGGRAGVTATAPAETGEATIVIDGLNLPNGGTFDFDAVLVEFTGSVGSYFPTKIQLERGEAYENSDGTWSLLIPVDQFEGVESIAGESTSTGTEVETVERSEVLSGSSTSSGSQEQILIYEQGLSGSSIGTFSETDEFSSAELPSGISASSGSPSDSAEAKESIEGSSNSTGAQTTIVEIPPPEPPTPSPLMPRRRLLAVRWKFFLCDSTTMELLGEIKQARGKNLQLALDKPGGCGFNIPIDYDLFKDVEEINHGIVAYRGDTPRYSGMIWNLNEDTENNSIAVQSVGWFETLNHRILRENVGYPPFSTGSVNAGQIVFLPAQGSVGASNYHPGGLLTIANAQRDTWLVEGTNKDVMQRIISYQRGQNIGQAITQLSEIEAGFDFWVDPLSRVLDITNWNEVPDKTEDIIFGYNWGPGNIEKLGRQFDPSVMANRVTALGKFGGGLAEDIESQEKYQLFEEMPQLSDVVDPNILLGYAGGEVLLRNRPRILYSFQPFPYSGSKKVPQPFDDYDIGDKFSFTAVKKPRIEIRNQAVRLYGMNIDITDEGNEKVTALQISP